MTCDEMGLMVWQEFMFAVALCPCDLVSALDYPHAVSSLCLSTPVLPCSCSALQNFLANMIRDEVRHQACWLGHHANIMLWSGNNEPGRPINALFLFFYSLLIINIFPSLFSSPCSPPLGVCTG